MARHLTSYGKYIPWLFAAADVATVNLVFLVLCIMYPQEGTARMWLIVELALLPELWWGLRHKPQRALQLDVVARQALSDVALHALFLLALMSLTGMERMPLGVLALFYAMLFAAFFVARLASRGLLKSYRRHGRGYARVVIVGANPMGERLAAEMARDAGFGFRVLGHFDEACPPGFSGSYLGPLAGLEEFMRKNCVHQVYYCKPSPNGNGGVAAEVLRVADACGAEFFFVPQLSRYVQRGMVLDTVGTMAVMGVRVNPLNSRLNRGIKRAFDIAVSGLFLCVYPLIYIPVAIAIKRSSPGPVYFSQERTGYHGRTFRCLKFRTMRSSDDADTRQATAGDPRVTRIGAFLRRTSIDELPQFINVWRGDMSVVGPRPHMLRHTEDYSRLIARYMTRHSVKPGITGWAQVTGWRGPTDQLWKMERRVEADVWYIEHWTLLLDLKIMVRTVLNAVRGEENAV